MTTVFVLTHAVDYEGETLLGVYGTRHDAEAAGHALLDDLGWEMSSSETFVIRPVEVGAAAEMRF